MPTPLRRPRRDFTGRAELLPKQFRHDALNVLAIEKTVAVAIPQRPPIAVHRQPDPIARADILHIGHAVVVVIVVTRVAQTVDVLLQQGARTM